MAPRDRHDVPRRPLKGGGARTPSTGPGGDTAKTGRRMPALRIPGFTLVMLGLLVVAVLVLAPTLRTLIDQRQQIADLQASVDETRQQVETLRERYARWDDPSYIRAQARDRLLYVMPGETSYLVIDDRGPAVASADDTPVSTTVQKTHSDPARNLLASIVTAGLTETPPEPPKGQQ